MEHNSKHSRKIVEDTFDTVVRNTEKSRFTESILSTLQKNADFSKFFR